MELKRVRKPVERSNIAAFENTWAPRSKLTPPSKPKPKKATPPKTRKRDKSNCPDMVPNCTLLCNSKKIGAILDGSQCQVSGCQGHRRIEEVCVDQHGGCGIFNLVCTRNPEHKSYFETGTYYQADDKDFRTGRYAEATPLVIGLIFAGCGFAGYEEVCAATGLFGWSWKSYYGYFWRFFYAAQDLWADSKQRLISNLESENRLHSVIGLFDGGWLHRGYASHHGSAAIVDTVTGAVL
jgi:hypothetical protein